METQEDILAKIEGAKIRFEEEMRKLDERQRRLLVSVIDRLDREGIDQIRQKLNQL